VGVKASVRKTSFFHDVGNPYTAVASTTNNLGCHINDARMAEFFFGQSD
jgi:hypothetical protein